MGANEQTIRTAVEKLLELSKSVDFGSISVQFSVQHGRIEYSRISQEITVRIQPELKAPAVQTGGRNVRVRSVS